MRWHAPAVAAAVNPATVASPAQVRTILAQVARLRPELAAFFGCLYYAALRPEEAVALCREDLILPAHGRGTIILTTACPRIGTATGEPAEVAARAGNSARVLHEVYLHCIDSQDDIVSQRIEDALNAGTGSSLPLQCVKASGYTHRRLPRDPVRYVSVNLRHRPASSPRAPARARQDRGRLASRRPTFPAAHTLSFGSTCD